MLKELNQIMDYLENHVIKDISAEDLAISAGIYGYLFKKAFFYLAGMPAKKLRL